MAAVQRVLRAQVFGGSGMSQHFTLLGLVTAGRDLGGRRFEVRALVDDVGALVRAVLRAGAPRAQVRVTDLSAGRLPALAVLADAFADAERVTVVDDAGRASGRGYYTGVCFKVFAGRAGRLTEVGDGGFVDWTQRLLANRKERLLISGLGVEMLAAQLS